MASDGEPMQVTSRKPFLIGVAGGSASGKSSVCNKIVEQLGQDAIDFKQRQVSILSQESFYRELSAEEAEKAREGIFNFDHPDAFDNQLIYQSLSKIKEGEPAKIPVYDVKSSSRTQEMTVMYPADVILFEGILVLYQKEIRDMLDMKLFVDTDSDTRLSRRVLRDIEERGRDLDKVLATYTNFVKPAFEEFCLPTKKYADVIIPRGADNIVAINLIGQHIKDILSGKKVRSSKPSHVPDSPTSEKPSGRGRERLPSESRSRPH